MKVYFLRVTASDLTQQGDRWVTATYDLYDNSVYKNFSVAKSTYGVGAATTFVGLERKDLNRFLTHAEILALNENFATDTGEVTGGRYIDASGRIDIISYNLDTYLENVTLEIYTSDDASDTYYKDEWELYGSFPVSNEIANIDASRYAKFAFNLAELDSNFVAYIRVEIDRPLVAPLFRGTRQLLSQYPEWMGLREGLNFDTTELATPNSMGAGVLNSLAGEWLDDISRELNYRDFQRYISTIDISQMAWCRKVSNAPRIIWSVKGDGVELARTSDFSEFRLAAGDDACFIDFNERVVYTAKTYTSLTINGVVFAQEPHHVWNSIDELGLFVDLRRLNLEGNDSYQKRIGDVFANRGGVGVESLKLALRRELNIWSAYGATPNSDYEGATPEILEMEDLEKDPKYFQPDGMPTTEFVQLAEQLSREYPTTWGRFRWNKAIWDIGGEDHSGYGVVPYRYDAATPSDSQVQSGVGDGDDLFVFRPDTFTGARQFDATLKIRGKERVTRTEYPAVEFDCVLRAKGDITVYSNPTTEVWFTLELALSDGATVVASFQMSSASDENLDQATPSERSFSTFDFIADETTVANLTFIDTSTQLPYVVADQTIPEDVPELEGVIPVDLINTVTLKQGRWSAGSYVDNTPGDVYEAWFSNNPSSVIHSGATPVTSISYGRDAAPYADASVDFITNFWPFEEDEEPAYDIVTGAGLQFSEDTSPTYNVPAFNGGTGINLGAGDYVDTGAIPFDGDTWSVEGRLQLSAGQPLRVVLATDEASYLGVVVQNGFLALINGGVVQGVSTTSVVDGNLHHFAITSSTTNGGKLYIDGALEDQWVHVSNVNPVLLGACQATLAATPEDSWLDGLVDELAFFSSELTLEQVGEHNTSGISYPDPIGAAVIPTTSVVMQSLEGPVSSAGTWLSEDYRYKIKLNGVEPMTSATSVTLDMPSIFYHPNATNTALELELETTNSFLHDIDDPTTIEYGGITVNDAGETVFVPASLILVDGDGTWTSGKKALSTATTSITFSTGSSPGVYPDTFSVWQIFERDQTVPVSGTVDENGPWRNGTPQPPGSSNDAFALEENLTRTDFGLVHTNDYIVTWMGVESSNSRVMVWLDTNTVKPANDTSTTEYPAGAIEETESAGVYSYSRVVLRARLRPHSEQWNPQIHSGYFYDRNDEYYLYANKVTQTTNQAFVVLNELARQGAPIIVTTDDATPITLRQVSFFDPSAANAALSLTNKEVITGTGTTTLYLAYPDVYDVTVADSSGVTVAASSSTATNALSTSLATSRDENYTVSYKLNNSFYADYDYLDATPTTQRTMLVFDSAPTGQYIITYEASDYDPATPVDVPLNPLYTVQNEGFLFLSHNEYTLDSLSVYLSPSKVLADGVDYIVATIQSLDAHGNPKPQQSFTLSTTFGTLDKATVITDHDGFAVITLQSTVMPATPVYSGTLTITGGVNASVDFEIEDPAEAKPRLFAGVRSEQIQADAASQNIIFGRAENALFQPASGVIVTWDKARSLYDLFTGGAVAGGTVTTDANGSFVVGPLTSTASSQSGYWFVSLEATVDGVTIGDVVFWYEYPVSLLGVENVDGLPQQAVQMELAPDLNPDYVNGVKYPVSYNERETLPAATPTLNWQPPSWYALSAYKKWQTGLSGNSVSTTT